jgi:uncharacterized protein with FMN-binding domain
MHATPAVTPKEVVTVAKTVQGAEGSAGRWGYVHVTLTVKKTTTTVGTKKTVTRKITKVTVPEYPNHTDRSVFINQNAMPLLVQETLRAQFNINSINVISGATDSSYAFGQSLQAALIAAKKV